MTLHHWRDNVMQAGDLEWRKKAPDLLLGRHPDMPPAGKFNAGRPPAPGSSFRLLSDEGRMLRLERDGRGAASGTIGP